MALRSCSFLTWRMIFDSRHVGSGRFCMALLGATLSLLLSNPTVCWAFEPYTESFVTRRAKMETAIKSIPFERIDRSASEAIRDVLNNPSFYRQLPQRSLDCDPQLLNFMVRHPEVMVNIWEMVGITNITAQRTGQRTFFADDGAGTKCNCELAYSDDSLHIYYGTGNYDGMLVPRTIKGRVVCVLRSQAQPTGGGHSGYSVSSTMDVFLKVDNLGADLLTRTLGPLVGRVTEHNFEETSKFVGQFSEFCANYPQAAESLASQLRVDDESIRREFTTIATRIGGQHPRAAAGRPSDEMFAETGRQTAKVEVSPTDMDSLELKDSLGQIRLATLPELAVMAELSDIQPDSSADQIDASSQGMTFSRDMSFSQSMGRPVSPEWSAGTSRTGNEQLPSSTEQSSRNRNLQAVEPAYDSAQGIPSGIVPRRSGVLLRR